MNAVKPHRRETQPVSNSSNRKSAQENLNILYLEHISGLITKMFDKGVLKNRQVA